MVQFVIDGEYMQDGIYIGLNQRMRHCTTGLLVSWVI